MQTSELCRLPVVQLRAPGADQAAHTRPGSVTACALALPHRVIEAPAGLLPLPEIQPSGGLPQTVPRASTRSVPGQGPGQPEGFTAQVQDALRVCALGAGDGKRRKDLGEAAGSD